MGNVISELYAFIAIDPTDPELDEGIMGFLGPNKNWVPLIGADMARVKDLRKIADRIQKVLCVEYRIKKFSYSGDIK